MQTKKQSFIEAISNTAVGFVISLAATFVIFPLVGVATTPSKNLLITIFFTVISIARGYVIRRFFNGKKNSITGVDLFCFSCGVNMPVKKVENKYHCANCGLKH